MKFTSRYSGVTLIELLIAVTISSILLIGVGSVYYNSKRTYLVQEEFSQLQEGARIATKFMIDDIRTTGFVGCLTNNDLSGSGNNAADPHFISFVNDTGSPENEDATKNFGIAVSGFEATGTSPGSPAIDLGTLTGPATFVGATTLPTYFTPLPQPGSDIIILRYAGGNALRISQPKADDLFSIDNLGSTVIDGNNCHTASGICVGHLLLATDCQKSRLFQATALAAVGTDIEITHGAAAGPLIGNSTITWGGGTGPDAFEVRDTYLYRAVSVAYYVAINPDTNVNPNGDPSLYRVRMEPGAVADELVTGVENMQILYGVDTDKSLTDGNIFTNLGDSITNRYITADAIATADENIVSVRIGMMLRTTNEVSTKSTATPTSNDYLMSATDTTMGTTVTSPADRRIRKVFTSTVKLRNKGIR